MSPDTCSEMPRTRQLIGAHRLDIISKMSTYKRKFWQIIVALQYKILA